ncbi:uncharacterized protein WM294_016646 [Sarcoramphus papa]
MVQIASCDLIAVTEMWWDESHDRSTAVDGYKQLRRDRQGKRGGRVALYPCKACINPARHLAEPPRRELPSFPKADQQLFPSQVLLPFTASQEVARRRRAVGRIVSLSQFFMSSSMLEALSFRQRNLFLFNEEPLQFLGQVMGHLTLSCAEEDQEISCGAAEALRAFHRFILLRQTEAAANSSEAGAGEQPCRAAPRQPQGPRSPPWNGGLGPISRTLGLESLWQQHPGASPLLPSRKPDRTLLPSCSLRGGFPSSPWKRAHCHPSTSPAPHRRESQAQSSP